MSDTGSNAEPTGVDNAELAGIFDEFIDPEAAEQSHEIAADHSHLFTTMGDLPSRSVLYSSSPEDTEVTSKRSAHRSEASGGQISMQDDTFTGKENRDPNEFQDEEVQNLDRYITYSDQDRLQERRQQDEVTPCQEECNRDAQVTQQLPAREREKDITAEDLMAPSTRSQSKQKRGRRLALSPTPNDSDGDPSPKRQFRERTVNQKYPYQSDKFRTKLTNSRGRSVKDKEVDNAVMRQVKGGGPKVTASHPRITKKPKRTSNASARSSVDATLVESEISTPGSSVAGFEIGNEFIEQHTDFWVEVKGSEDMGASIISMQKASTLDKLIDFVESLDGDSLSWTRCFLHWKVGNIFLASRESS